MEQRRSGSLIGQDSGIRDKNLNGNVPALPQTDPSSGDRPSTPSQANDTVDWRTRLWTPFFLRRTTLLGFVIFYLALMVSLMLLLIMDKRNHGLATAQSKTHYLWTYGPTAALSLAAAFWGQVEYRAKQTAPWLILRSGPTQASKTLLIDYVSESQIMALFNSVRARHSTVTLAVLGTLLIRLLTVISTSLLVLQYQPWTFVNTPLQMTEQFSPRNINISKGDGSPVRNAITKFLYNTSYPPGTSAHLAVPSVNLRGQSSDQYHILRAILPAFRAKLDCEIANVTHQSPCYKFVSNEEPAHTDIEFKTRSCSFSSRFDWVGSECPGSFSAAGMDMHASYIYCNGTELGFGEHPGSPWRYVLSFALPTGNQSQLESYTNAHSSGSMSNFTIMTIAVCSPRYTISPSLVELDPDQGLHPSVPTWGSTDLDQHIPGVDEFGLMKLYEANVEQNNFDLLFHYNALRTETIALDYSEHIDSTFSTMVIYKNLSHISDLANPNTLRNAIEEVFPIFAAQVAKEHLILPVQDSSGEDRVGDIETTRQRLRVRDLAVWWMLAIIVILAIVTVWLCYSVPQGVTSQDVGSIGTFATVLARSTELSNCLVRSGTATLSELQELLDDRLCMSRVFQGTFRLDLYENHSIIERQKEIADKTAADVTWWRPFPISAAYKISVITLLAALVISLELLYERSRREAGLAEVEDHRSVRYAWIYAPVLTMLLVQLLIGMTASSSMSLFPFHELRYWPSAPLALFNDQPAQLPPISFCNSVATGQWAATAIALATLLAPFLTIVTSGLYTAEAVPTTQPSLIQTDDGLIPWTWTIDASVALLASTAFVSQALVNNSMAYPDWTKHGLVFPKISFTPNASEAHDINPDQFAEELSNITVSLTALRPSVNCTFIPNSDMNITFDYNVDDKSSDWWDAQPTVNIEGPLPGGCVVSETNTHWALPDTNDSAAFAWTQDLQYDVGPLCPSLVAVYGWSWNVSSINMIMCDGYVESISVDTTFSLPSFQILVTDQDESTAQRAENGITSLTSLTDIFSFFESWNFPNGTSFDPMFTMLFYGTRWDPPALSMEEILGEPGFPKLVDTLQYWWRLMYPQLLNIAGRHEYDADVTRPTSEAIIKSNRVRLQQSAISTRILEFLLGLLGVCIMVSFWAMNTKEVLPKNPCSIAAVASLLAGSEMLKEEVIPPGSEWLGDGELVHGIFKGRVFSMGWWGEGESGHRRFGIDLGKAQWS